MSEIWKFIQGYEGLYKVSNKGGVRRVGRRSALSPATDSQGRLFVALCRGGVKQRHSVHRLVLEAFTGPCPPGMECRHLNGDHLDNRHTNLAWGTHKENMQDKTAHGTQLIGEKNHNAKLTEQDVIAIRASSLKGVALAKMYGVSSSVIYYVKHHKTWKHVAPQHQPAFSSK